MSFKTRTFRIRRPVYETEDITVDLPAYSKDVIVNSDECDTHIFRCFYGPLRMIELVDTVYYDYEGNKHLYSISTKTTDMNTCDLASIFGVGDYASTKEEFLEAMNRFLEDLK